MRNTYRYLLTRQLLANVLHELGHDIGFKPVPPMLAFRCDLLFRIDAVLLKVVVGQDRFVA
ncbi:MAG: hypothetical protein K0R28_5302 [Paenibacillus sp.]|nr:hypothetical protein [Paenibacillus sp.]